MKQIFTFLLLLQIGILTAQTQDENSNIIHIESGEGKNIKSCKGYFFSTNLTKDQVTYNAILANKIVLENSTEIRLFFKTKDETKPFIVTLPIKNNPIIYKNNNELVIIPFGLIARKIIENKEITNVPGFFNQSVLLELVPEIKESDLNKIIDVWEFDVNARNNSKL